MDFPAPSSNNGSTILVNIDDIDQSTSLLRQQPIQDSHTMNTADRKGKKRQTPPLPVELIRPPIVNHHLEEIITGNYFHNSFLSIIISIQIFVPNNNNNNKSVPVIKSC